MNVSVSGRQMDVGEALTSHAESGIAAASEKYFSDPLNASVVFAKERAMFKADINIHVHRGIDMRASGEANDVYAAFDQALDRVQKRLRRYHRKLKEHKGPTDASPARYYMFPIEETATEEQPPAEAQATIVADQQTEIPILAPADAAMRLDLGDLPVLMFKNAGNKRLNVVYRRRDGHIGWIDPDES
ncbi:MAG: ribosome-associated translation inhibitor RaiA [Alphaproteobacteria bacterium]|nr:ribosome-associated translation inhibitor RaiA [Alphaproteobacteria bacterium]